MRHIGVIGIAVVILAAACSGGDDDAGSSTTAPGDRVAIDEPADPVDLDLVAFDDDTPVSIADYAGRPLVVNFFASWCAPCVREMPAIENVKQEVGDAVAFLGVATNDRVEDARALVDRTGITWDLARDPLGDAAAELGIVSMPTTFFVSAEGELVDHHTGALTEDSLWDILEEDFGVTA